MYDSSWIMLKFLHLKAILAIDNNFSPSIEHWRNFDI